jgi:phosphoribosylamine--glycine ligase
MNILIIGAGAREHAIALALARSTLPAKLYGCGPFLHPGISKLTKDYATGDLTNAEFICGQARLWNIQMAIIGLEAPLACGIADALWAHNVPTIGPKKILAQLETCKQFTRELLQRHQIAGSPRYQTFTSLVGVPEFLDELGSLNYVIKANGLMGGKGVKVAGEHLHSLQDALHFCETLLKLGQTFLIEEKIIGQEFSLLYFCDGETLVPMPLIQDHKRAFQQDLGPNTGGMGSYSMPDHSLPFVTTEDLKAADSINHAVLKALTSETGERYVGILYSSFMANKDGVKLIEYNVRFGDPEALNVLAILETDLIAIFEAMLAKQLAGLKVEFAQKATVCKYKVPEGYPDSPNQTQPIAIPASGKFLMGGIIEIDGKYFATGSRTVAAVGVADTLEKAENIAEEAMISIEGPYFHRSDIGTAAAIAKRIKQMQMLREC